jgi:hypothetical protein
VNSAGLEAAQVGPWIAEARAALADLHRGPCFLSILKESKVLFETERELGLHLFPN